MRQVWEKIKSVMALRKRRKTRQMQRLWIRKGIALDQEDRSQEALTCYDTALQINPTDPMAWNFRGGTLLKLGRLREAREAFQNVIKFSPPEYPKYFMLHIATAGQSDCDIKNHLEDRVEL